MEWSVDSRTIKLDDSIVFGQGYDYFGLEHLRQEAWSGKIGYLIWPETSGCWRVYETSEGGLSDAPSEADAKAMAEKWAQNTQSADPCEPADNREAVQAIPNK